MSKHDNSKPAAGNDGLLDDAALMPSADSNSAGCAVARPRGYPLHIIVNGKADEKFCCSCCKYVLRNPMQSSCGHRFCHDCIKAMQTSGPVQCQSCVEEGITDEDSFLDFQGIFEDKAARREMRKLEVRCMWQGCQWKGLFNDFMKHEEECEKKMVPCSQCGANVSKGRLVNHEAKSCPKRTIHCNYCREQVVFELREKHNEECPKYLVKCDKCQTPVERSKLLSHQETVCANRVLTCPLPDCNKRLAMDKFLTHLTKDETVAKHITYLLDRSEVSEKRLQKLEARSPSPYMEASSLASPPSDQAHASASHSPSDIHPEQCEASDRMHGEGAQADGGLIHEDRQKLKLHEDLMSVLHSEILRCITKGEAMGRGLEKSENRIRDCYAKLEAIDTRLNTLDARYKEVSRRPFDQAEYGELVSEDSGTFTWIIKSYGQVIRDATLLEREMVCSPPFFSCPGGYHLRLKLYANGEGSENRSKNVSLYLQTIKSPHDDLLLWPFTPKIHFMLVDVQDFRHHHVQVYEADPMSPASHRPRDDVGGTSIAAGCPTFISVQDMNQKMRVYWPKDTVYLRFHIQIPESNMERLNSLNPLNFIETLRSSVRS